MKSFSGGSSFSFEIERYLDKSTGELLTLKDSRLPENPDEFEFELKYINLTITGTASFTPGRMTGPWEDCYPDDSTYDIESIVDENNNDWSSKLTSSENDEVVTELFRWAEENSQEYDFEYSID